MGRVTNTSSQTDRAAADPTPAMANPATPNSTPKPEPPLAANKDPDSFYRKGLYMGLLVGSLLGVILMLILGTLMLDAELSDQFLPRPFRKMRDVAWAFWYSKVEGSRLFSFIEYEVTEAGKVVVTAAAKAASGPAAAAVDGTRSILAIGATAAVQWVRGI